MHISEGFTTNERSPTAEEKRQSQLKRDDEVPERLEPQSSSCIRKPSPKYVRAFVVVVPHWDQHMVRVVASEVLQALMETRHDDARVSTEGER